ncbi:MAG TPA: peptide ABC transporter substrate-binding protein [Roseiflexaceae bacterium]|nr:peptide ABC transporter substrate-binding protein [Roseiflexaceae bacterium]
MRTRLPSLATLLLAIVLLAACGNQSVATPTAPAAGVTPVSGGPAAPAPRGDAPTDTLRWSLEGISDLSSIDPAKPGDAQAITVINSIFGGLVRLNDRLEVVPEGAASWQVSGDGTVYTFALRDGLSFADGTAVTAGDFVYSINRALSPETASFGAPFQLGHIVGAKDVVEGRASEARGLRAVDAKTLEITLDAPLAYFLAQLTYPYTFAVPRNLVESGASWEERAFGTGPYKVKEWKRGQSLLIEVNERYWGGTAGIPNILYRFNRDSETAYQLYQTGELDIMGSQQNPVPAAHIAEVQSLPDFKTSASLATRYIGFNNQLPPFDNVDVRRAFALATDRQTLANQVLAGAVVPAERILPTGLFGTELPVRPLAFSATDAVAALEQAGFPNGQGLPAITLAYGQEGDNELVAQALQSLWEQNLGVKINLQALELATFSRNLDTTFYTPTQGLQMYLSIWGADYPDPQNFLSQQLRSDTANNNGHFSDTTFDQLVDEADRLGSTEDRQRRLQLYNQAEQIAVDKVGWLPLYFPRFQVLVRPRVEGLVVTPGGLLIPDWTKLKLAA